jgi:mannose-6-phosphate isomerase
LFTSSRLSVQVHPKDDYGALHHQSLGKTEAWFVIDAKPGADVALGFKKELTPKRFRDSAVSGEIEALLDWRPVEPGDVIFVPAGTVHAIGAGLTICEIQQNSDITYRIYDYGRPRELHLEHACAVSDLGPYIHKTDRKQIEAGRSVLVESNYFHIERLHHNVDRIVLGGDLPHYALLIPLAGNGYISGEPFARGEVWFVPAGGPLVELISGDGEWLLAYPGGNKPVPITFA